jgi:hypothetical protein
MMRPVHSGDDPHVRCKAMARRRSLVLVAIAASASVFAFALAAAHATPWNTPMLRFTVVTTTPLKLTDIVWTGTRFFYVDNTTNRVFAADRTGMVTGLFATMPNIVEETRCVSSPARYGFPKGGLFCHSPDNRIYRISPAGELSQFALIPETEISDGALAVDDVGRFGHRLVAATGRSGNPGGSVYTIDTSGKTAKVGSYRGPGGAENVVIAPLTFGTQGGSALLTIDAGSTGSLVAVDAKGRAATIAKFSDGANPIAVIPRRLRLTGVPRAGFYVVDTFPGTPLIAAAGQFAGQSGNVIVGSEQMGLMWLVAPTKSGFTSTRFRTNLNAPPYNLEGAIFVP